jgi:hypothetical protein
LDECLCGVLERVCDAAPIPSQKIPDRDPDARQICVRKGLHQLFEDTEDDDKLRHLGSGGFSIDHQSLDYSDCFFNLESLAYDDCVEVVFPKNKRKLDSLREATAEQRQILKSFATITSRKWGSATTSRDFQGDVESDFLHFEQVNLKSHFMAPSSCLSTL